MVVSGLEGGSYVDHFVIPSLEHWHYVNLVSSRVELFKHWSNVQNLVWIVSLLENWPYILFYLFFVPLNVELSNI